MTVCFPFDDLIDMRILPPEYNWTGHDENWQRNSHHGIMQMEHMVTLRQIMDNTPQLADILVLYMRLNPTLLDLSKDTVDQVIKLTTVSFKVINKCFTFQAPISANVKLPTRDLSLASHPESISFLALLKRPLRNASRMEVILHSSDRLPRGENDFPAQFEVQIALSNFTRFPISYSRVETELLPLPYT